MRILAIETSCDETSIAIADFNRRRVRVSSHIILSQIPVHKKFGGVVPNLAKREHQKNLVPILMQAMREAGLLESGRRNKELGKQKIPTSYLLTPNSILEREPELLRQFEKRIVPLTPPKIDAIAVTYGPGLAPALWVGVNFSRALAYLWGKPLIPIDHMSGHLYSALLQPAKRISNFQFSTSKQIPIFKVPNIKLPALALLVSGGHTQLVLMRGHGKFKIIGETLDDAAGEAFDKVARILGLGYPGGPEISRLAERGNAQKYKFPRPMINSKDYNFSFSGLKTAILYFVRDHKKFSRTDLAASFEKAIVDVLISKTIRAAKEFKVKAIILGGGVAANKKLQERLGDMVKKELPNSLFLIPDFSLTGDNALMIATAAYFSGKKKAPNKVGADANLRLS